MKTREYDTDSWFRYVSAFYSLGCDIANENCSTRAIQNAKLDNHAIDGCISRAVLIDKVSG